MDRHVLEDVAMLIAREHRDARNRQPLIPDTFDDPQTSHEMLLDLLAAGFVGVVAVDDGRVFGAMCGKTNDDVGFVPAHGLAVEPNHVNPTTIVVQLFAELAPALLDDGASRFTIDHVAPLHWTLL